MDDASNKLAGGNGSAQTHEKALNNARPIGEESALSRRLQPEAACGLDRVREMNEVRVHFVWKSVPGEEIVPLTVEITMQRYLGSNDEKEIDVGVNAQLTAGRRAEEHRAQKLFGVRLDMTPRD